MLRRENEDDVLSSEMGVPVMEIEVQFEAKDMNFCR